MKVVILAGGLGTRISEESYLRPKPMIEIGGAPILWHIMKYYSSFGYNDFVICCGYKGYMIKEYFANYYLHHSDITFDFSCENSMLVHSNTAEPWRVTLAETGLNTQTGGRVKRIEKYTEGKPFMLTYGDGVGNINLAELVDAHKRQKADNGAVLTLTAIQPAGRFGILELDESKNHILGFREKSKEDSNWINAGFMLAEPEIFSYIKGDDTVLEREPMESLSAFGKLCVHKHYGFWQCMDTQRDKFSLEDLWSKDKAPWKLWK